MDTWKIAMSEQPVENSDTKPAKEKSNLEKLLDKLIELLVEFLFTPVVSIIVGIAMIVWYDWMGDFWETIGKGTLLWLLWSRPVGVIIVYLGLKEIWKRHFLD